MRVRDFIDLVNHLDCEEFSDIPEDGVELVASRVNEQWSYDDTYSTAMNIYRCDDGYVAVRGLYHMDNYYFRTVPDDYSRLPHCKAFKASQKLVPTWSVDND